MRGVGQLPETVAWPLLARCPVEGFRLQASAFGFRVWRSSFRVWRLGFEILELEAVKKTLGSRVYERSFRSFRFFELPT
jgi:hypothetical protein